MHAIHHVRACMLQRPSVTKVVSVVFVQFVDAVHAVLLRIAPYALKREVRHAALRASGSLLSCDVWQFVIREHGVWRHLRCSSGASGTSAQRWQ